jgi:hypothetical protein
LAHQSAPRAITTIEGATIRCDQQGAVWIAADEMWSDFVIFLAERIVEITGHRYAFFSPRHALQPDRARRVVGIT